MNYGPIALLAFTLLGCSQPGMVIGRPPSELPWPAAIEVRFNHRDNSRYRSPLGGQWRNGDDFEGHLIELIDGARTELLVAVQELTLAQVAAALVRAHQRGVIVQVVLENSYSAPWADLHESDLPPHARQRLRRLEALADVDSDGVVTARERRAGDAVGLLHEGGVPVIDDTEDGSRGSGLMHHKFMVIDKRQVITGSANFTSSGVHGDGGAPRTRGNVNHLLSITSTELAAVFQEEFQILWGDGPGGLQNSRFGRGKPSRPVKSVMVDGTRMDVLFAPHSKRSEDHGLQLIAQHLSAAKRSIDLALFVFSAQSLTDVLAQRVQSGVAIRLLADPGFASRSFSEVLDLLGVALPDRFCKLEKGNRPLAKPLRGVGTPRLARGDKLHHKFAVIDNRKVITGSFNWSPSAAHQNDETLLVIHSPTLAAHFTHEIDRMWRGAELGVTARMRRKLERQRTKCGSGEERT
ncbi:MAG: phospholipase D-like domain-containing protein [Synechococcus sp.]|uniref:phospholipase D-like domain-containing protein n=1 Tax=Synechococcus sp. BMK-MC-1 TaxID=1442551 RepID=UPI0016496056|nr:phospholipase D-like domain-containing protein [Synechococcus sp. BMK-MC-1]QNI68781.1 competence protein [Synechococcus sp. BMK-MC-1]